MFVTIPSPGNIVSQVGNATSISGPIRFIRLAAMRGGWMPKSPDMRRTFKNKDPNP